MTFSSELQLLPLLALFWSSFGQKYTNYSLEHTTLRAPDERFDLMVSILADE